MARIVLGVSGGIAAYKACSLLRLFTEAGHDVTVVPTASALQFVGAPTWEALSGQAGAHRRLGRRARGARTSGSGQTADLVVVAPATADLLAKAAHGLAGDLLTNVLLTARCPVVMAPAMHTEMWDHAATQANVSTLAERGIHLIPPASGRLTGADTGPGRLPEPEALYAVCERILAHARRANHLHASGGSETAGEPDVSAPTQASDARARRPPGRHLRRRHARAARPGALPRQPQLGQAGLRPRHGGGRRGATVTLLAANTALAGTRGRDRGRRCPPRSSCRRRSSVAAKDADVVVMAAAVADFRPAHYADAKIKKTHDPADPDAAPTIELVRNPDILAGLVEARGEDASPVIVGFAAETGDDARRRARARSRQAGSQGLRPARGQRGGGRQDVRPGRQHRPHPAAGLRATSSMPVPASKEVVAAAVWDAVQEIL